jgi:hypothetical protein
VKKIVDEKVEPGNQQKCQLQAYRNHIADEFFISERTFWRYMKLANGNANDGQLSLNF